MNKITCDIDINKTVPFKNNAAFCVGTGRMNLALRHEYHKQLEKVQKDIGFSYIRGHGLFCDDMAVYHTRIEDGVEKEEYNFRYIDMVFDVYLSLGLKPFVEFGFMPEKLASGDKTVFYWKANVTPPTDYGKWARLVAASIDHWINRYGRDEVVTWFFEVWNEPNWRNFWKNTDMDEYFRLYDVTSRAVKSRDERLRVGGPAIMNSDDERWMRCFLEYCKKNKVPLDFVTRHSYGTKADDNILKTQEEFLSEPAQSRAVIDSFPEYRGMELHMTEFNTSYNVHNHIHDSNLNAAYVARLLSELGDTCASYSYWTFGDVFEEEGVSFTPFSGCFGLMANGMIPKPTYWAFVFYKDLYPEAAAKNEHLVATKSGAGDLRGIAWNPDKGNDEKLLRLTVNVKDGLYFLLVKTVDEICCHPLDVWQNMGSPAYPSKRQMDILSGCSCPRITTKRIDVKDGPAAFDIDLTSNALCFFELQRVEPELEGGCIK